jgi:ABC-2 type transport system permease protein
VLTRDGDNARDAVAQHLKEAGIDARVEPTSPNLEDVFVAATKRVPRGAEDGGGARVNLRRLLSIVVKELRQLRRDRLTFAMMVGIPTMQLLLFGYAINLDIRYLDAAVLDQAQTVHSREVVAQLGQTDVMNFKYRLAEPQQIDELLRAGKISAALVIPPDFERRLATRDRVPLQIVVDGSDQVIQQAARQLAGLPLDSALNPGGTVNPNQTLGNVEIVNFYNPERRAPVNTVPGLIGVILTMTMVLFTAMALVRERERGNLEFLIATPVSAGRIDDRQGAAIHRHRPGPGHRRAGARAC